MPSVINSILEKLQAEKDLPSEFENLTPGAFQIESQWSAIYNCIAFAAGETHRKWWPIALKFARADRFWPDGAPRTERLGSFVVAFEIEEGFKPCKSNVLEDGIEKVAIYVKGKKPTHMARQLADGTWVSKLGDKQDISHNTLHEVEGREYGKVVQILCRERETGEEEAEQEKD